MAQFLLDQKQNEYLDMIAEIMEIRKIGDIPRAYVRTYGCQQNVADGERIKGMLKKAGYTFTDDVEKADFILFNTCAVREHAEDRVFGNVGALKKLKRKNPRILIALCGCMMEQEHVQKKIHDSFPFVGLVFGTHCMQIFPKLLYDCLVDGKRQFLRNNDDKNVYEGIPVERDRSFKGFLPIMYGCDNFCTYCIVPYVRGRERSRSSKAILKEAKEMIDSGFKDITLLGQNVNSYGKGLDEDTDFSTLLKEIDSIPGDYWLRFMTSHPKDCSKKLIDTIRDSKHISLHLHLPFQSGSNKVLRDMNRNYTREKYLDIINYAKEQIPDISITSDIIVGFPTETYEDFKQTLSLIEEARFTSLFTFIYSKREGTPAAKMTPLASQEEIGRWFKKLLDAQERIAAQRCSSMVGQVHRVLAEEKTKRENELSGRTSGNIIVEFPGDESLIGTFLDIKITKARNWILKGELVNKE